MKAYEKKTFVLGRNIHDYEEEGLIGAIRTLQDQKKSLSKLSVTSTKLEKRIRDIDTAIGMCVSKIDGGHLVETDVKTPAENS